MARIRSVKPGYNKSLDIVPLSIPCRLHFVMLWTYADDEGRGIDHPGLIKGELWALDDVSESDIEGWQAELAANGRIVRYEHDGRRFFEIVDFREHQHPNKPQPSKCPAPNDPFSRDYVPVREDSRSEKRALPPVVGEERSSRGEVVPASAKPERARNEHWDALTEACGIAPGDVTSAMAGRIGKALKDLAAVNATPEEIRRRAVNYRSHMPDATLTPTALAANWGLCAEPKRRSGSKRTESNAAAREQVMAAIRGGS